MAMPPMLRWALARVPLSDAEKARLEREDAEAKGFVPNLERLLLIADDSAHGHLASRLAGVLAGSRGIVLTLLRPPERKDATHAPAAETIEKTMKAAGDKSKEQTPDADIGPDVR
jgi:hypothetical protein